MRFETVEVVKVKMTKNMTMLSINVLTNRKFKQSDVGIAEGCILKGIMLKFWRNQN